MDSEVALKLLKKYGFNSVNDLPYLSVINNKVGIAFKYIDNCYGLIERTTFFDDIEEMELFLKLYRKYIESGKGITLALDNYQVMFPNLIYTKDERLVLSEELLEEVVDKEDLSDLHKLKIVAKNLLNYYSDVSLRQVKHINNVSILSNILKKKEGILENEIRILKKKKPSENIGIIKEDFFRYDDSLFNTYTEYLNRATTKEHFMNIINNLWNLNRKLELSKDYYKSINECKEIADKIKLVDLKIDYVRSLKGKNKLWININANLKQIEKSFVKEKIDNNYLEQELEKVKRKYSLFNKISMYYLDDYLKESFLDENYEYIASKHSKYSKKTSRNEILTNLRKAYQLLSFDERRVLTLFNSKYRNIFELILEKPDFAKWNGKKMAKYLEGIESVSRFKEECIDELCQRLVQEVNRNIREKYFVDINFKSFKFFVEDMIRLLVILKNINDKMVLSGDIRLFMDFKNVSSLKNKYVYYLVDNNNSVIGDARTRKNIVGIFKILEGTPVLYSPYNLDFGDLYDKSSKVIREVNNNIIGLVIDVNDAVVMRDRNLKDVYYYKNIVDSKGGITIVSDVKYSSKLSYCNFTIYKR